MIKFLKGKINTKSLNGIKNSYNSLPEDEYLKFVNRNFRNRRFSKIIHFKNKFFFTQNTIFKQNKIQNRYLGGIRRKYQPIKTNIIKKINIFIKDNFNFLIDKKKLNQATIK